MVIAVIVSVRAPDVETDDSRHSDILTALNPTLPQPVKPRIIEKPMEEEA
jgi:hypothetical protein